MSGFGMITEDPFYDEDGVLIDEDGTFDWEDAEDPRSWVEIVDGVEKFDPYDTINS